MFIGHAFDEDASQFRVDRRVELYDDVEAILKRESIIKNDVRVLGIRAL